MSAPENLHPHIKTKEDVERSINNISKRIPGLFTEPIKNVFLDAVTIADSAQKNEKECNDLLRIILSQLETLENSLSGVKSDKDASSKIDMNKYLQILKSITKYINEISKPNELTETWILSTNEEIADKIKEKAMELNKITKELIQSYANIIVTMPIPDQQMWEITCLMQGAQASRKLMKQFTKSDKDIQEDRSRIVRGSKKQVIKKILKATQEDVAEKELEKPIVKFNPTDEKKERQFWSLVAVADYLKDCKYILKFYGIVEYNEKRHTLFEWAENGDLGTYLKEFPNLPWSFKIKVAWEISSALSHCHQKGILHHDIRSHNVMLSENHVAKLTNFETSRPESGDISWSIKIIDEVLRYGAPEKDSQDIRYTVKNDVYSFGILMWEIASQKSPFGEEESGLKVFERVINNERPDIKLIVIPEDKATRKYVDKYLEIMREAWDQKPGRRPEISIICERLRNLYLDYKRDVKDNFVLPMRSSLDNLETKEEDPDVPDLEKALQYHESENYNDAFLIYEKLANSGNIEAKFRAGSYLAKGTPYLRRDIAKAERYIREAADNGHVEAQYRYYQLLIRDAKSDKEKLTTAKKYLKLAVEHNYASALFDYGEHLCKGKFGERDQEKGKQMLFAAHYRMNPKALNALKTLKTMH